MRRIHLATIILSFSLLPLGGFAAVPRDNSGSHDVPMFRDNAAHTGEMPGPGPSQEITEIWRFQVGDDFWTSPAVADDVVYVAGGDGSLFAIDAISGQQLWDFHAEAGFESSPAIADGVVYVGSGDEALYAIDAASGQQRWVFPVPDVIEESSPAVIEGVVYIGCDDGTLYAVDAASGQQRWMFPTGNAMYSSPAVALGVVYVGSEDGNLYAVEADSGQQRWSYSAGSNVTSSPAVVDGVVYVGCVDGNLYAIGSPTLAMATATAQAQQAQIIQQSWDTYFQEIGISLSASVAELPGVTLEPNAAEYCGNYHRLIAIGEQGCRVYPAQVVGSSGGSWVALSIFDSNEAADEGLAYMSGGMLRSGWQQVDVDGLTHDHVCLTLRQDQMSQGACYMTRDDALIVSFSYLNVSASDAVLLNATDLARLMSDAYDQVERPE